MVSVEKLKEVLKKVNAKSKKTTRSDIEKMNIEDLTEFFESLNIIQKKINQRLKDSEKLIIEEYKLAIMEALEKKLKINETPRQENPQKQSTIKKIFANTFSVLTPIFTGIGGFLGCKSLLSFIPSIANPIVTGVSIGVGLIEGALSVAIEVMDIRKCLGVSSLNVRPTICTYRKQLEATQKSHKLLLSSRCINQMNASDYSGYRKIVTLFNEDIKQKNALLTKQHKESPIRKGVKCLVGLTEATLFAGSGYLMGKCILGLCAASLIATPIGWALCGAAALFSLGSFYYLRKKNMSNAIDKISGDPKNLKKSQHNFIHGDHGIKRFDQEMDLIISSKKQKEMEMKVLTLKVKSLEEKVAHMKLQPAAPKQRQAISYALTRQPLFSNSKRPIPSNLPEQISRLSARL